MRDFGLRFSATLAKTLGMAWREFCLSLAAFIYVAMTFQDASADDLEKGGRAKFEIFGMMDEYLMSCAPFDGETIASFEPGESVLAARFAKLLDAYCTEEGINHGFVRSEGPGRAITFRSPLIATSIHSHYEKAGLGDGKLRESEFSDASGLDMLRYLRGAYFRYNYKHTEVFWAANSVSKMHNLAVCLHKLGCRGVRFYICEAIPTPCVLIFSPTERVREFLGIRQTVMFDELNSICHGGLRLREQIGSD